MEHTWGTPDTRPPQTPEQTGRQSPRWEYAWLTLGVAAITSAIALFVIDHLSPFDFSRGGYSILTGLFVVGGCGWLTRSRETRIMAHNRGCADRISRELAELTGAVKRLERRVDAQPLTPEAEAALRRINMKLLNGGAESN